MSRRESYVSHRALAGRSRTRLKPLRLPRSLENSANLLASPRYSFRVEAAPVRFAAPALARHIQLRHTHDASSLRSNRAGCRPRHIAIARAIDSATRLAPV